MSIEIIKADYTLPRHAEDVAMLFNVYAADPMGNGKPFTDQHLQAVISGLREMPTAFSVLAYVDGTPAGLCNCFFGFSTFAAKPLVNVHDVVVVADFRGMSLSGKMLRKVEEIAQARGCAKLTLEVLEGNTDAQRAYQRFGFASYMLDPELGRAMFWTKAL